MTWNDWLSIWRCHVTSDRLRWFGLGRGTVSGRALPSASFSLQMVENLVRSNNLYSLEPRHIQHSRCNTLHSLNAEDYTSVDPEQFTDLHWNVRLFCTLLFFRVARHGIAGETGKQRTHKTKGFLVWNACFRLAILWVLLLQILLLKTLERLDCSMFRFFGFPAGNVKNQKLFRNSTLFVPKFNFIQSYNKFLRNTGSPVPETFLRT